MVAKLAWDHGLHPEVVNLKLHNHTEAIREFYPTLSPGRREFFVPKACVIKKKKINKKLSHNLSSSAIFRIKCTFIYSTSQKMLTKKSSQNNNYK